MPNSQSPSRLRYFFGRILTVDDFSEEQNYFIEKFKRHNRSLHGFGVVSGLKVTTSGGKVKVGAGTALDCQGNEIIVPSEQLLSTPSSGSNVAYVTLKYSEETAGASSLQEPTTILESFELVFTADNQNKGHRHLKARWLTCGKVHGLTLAKIRLGSTGWRVDRSYTAPKIK